MYRIRTPFATLGLSALALATLLGACDKQRAMGGANNLVVVAPDSVWAALEPEIEASLEPRSFTVRDERVFETASVAPTDEDWGTLRLVRNVLAIGEPADPWMAEILESLKEPAPAAPAIIRAENVWAIGQSVTAILLPPGSGVSAAAPLLPEVGTILVEQLTNYARRRMFVTGADSALADSLRQVGGFSVTVPRVYRFRSPRPGVFVFRNDNPDPSQLIREVIIASQPASEVPNTPSAAVEWRSRLARELNDPIQVTEDTIIEAREVRVNGQTALEVQGIWTNDPTSWPAGGPYLTRLIRCPDNERVLLVDAWLYAPGDPKFEYMVQLQTIMNSVSCAG